jgi:hypothetical protein
MRFILPIISFFAFLVPTLGLAYGGVYTARNIHIEIDSADMLTARDQALLKAQKHALEQFITLSNPQDVSRLKAVSDASLSRTVKDFSLRNERMGGGIYQADFMIRFDQTRLQGLLAGYSIPTPPVNEIDLSNLRFEQDAVIADVAVTDEGGQGAATPAAPAIKPVVILPVLDIGSRRVVWDDPNPWREGWQKQASFKTKTPFIIPLGDVSDLTDIPDGQFLTQGYTGKQPDLAHMRERYGADKIYVLIARSQGAALNPAQNGLAITIHEFDGTALVSKGTIHSKARPGYMFDDGVTFVMPKIDALAQGIVDKPVVTAQPVSHPAAAASTLAAIKPAINSQFIRATIPIPNLSAWVRIQQNLRRVAGVRNINTDIINPDSVTIRIETTSDVSMLLQHIQAAGFQITDQGNGHYILTNQAHGA